jgi:translation machinery-associated protein 16
MAPSKTPKKEKIFHPSSRKAGQLTRHAHRKDKLQNLASKRGQKHNSLRALICKTVVLILLTLESVDVYGFFYHAIPEDGALTLEELHHIIREVWLTRFDEELEQEKATRRKGRPKSAKETRLEELKSREAEEYRTGLGKFPVTPLILSAI